MNKALNYLSLARKAGRLEVGEEPTGAAARACHARLVVVACDASEHAVRRAKSYVAGSGQQCLVCPFTKDEMGMCIGRRELSMAAITDPALALAFVQSLGEPEKYEAALADLQRRTQRVRQRQLEEKAHQSNLKRGKKPSASSKKPNGAK
ncbi:MAG: 50S ribosomal protein L7 [Oscillospiraceae bacterium]|nr:50S ribosomal protein L7 [Oscillospiraceae bacterium]